MLDLGRIRAARERLSGRVVTSPCRESRKLGALIGGTALLKLENVQRTGSFKERGACNKLLTLTDDEKGRGVVAASAGNHAQAVAYHAGRLGIRTTVVMPSAAPLVKVAAARDFGARVVLHGQNYDEAAAHAESIARSEGATLLHPFEDLEVIAGQGTIGLELLEQIPDLDAVVVPVGGGGLIAGIACAVKETKPDVLVYGVESETFPGMKRALEHDTPGEIPGGKTIADGIAVRRVGSLARAVVERYVDGIELVDEEEIAEAILMLLEGDKTVAEGAGAVGFAGLASGRLALGGRKVGVIVSGGNIDVNLVARIIERGLVKSGRRTRLTLVLPDVTGALARLATRVAELGTNILEINHDRAFAGVELGETLVELVL
ncbi:MAG TPA: threonine ammonia-lyase, partial [Polyangiaceae bacterium]